MTDYCELLIGCGSQKKKLIPVNGPGWKNLITLDINSDHNPNVVWDLTNLPLPFPENSFDEIHAYEVLEHTGSQGDYKFFFAQFSEFWRILKPGGYLAATVPSATSPWAWGDPSHTRIIQKETLVFLSQDEYTRQIGNTSMSDFRNIYQADFSIELAQEANGGTFFALRAVKPSRITIPVNR